MPIYVFMHFTYANTPKHPETLLSRYNITHGTDEDAESWERWKEFDQGHRTGKGQS